MLEKKERTTIALLQIWNAQESLMDRASAVSSVLQAEGFESEMYGVHRAAITKDSCFMQEQLDLLAAGIESKVSESLRRVYLAECALNVHRYIWRESPQHAPLILKGIILMLVNMEQPTENQLTDNVSINICLNFKELICLFSKSAHFVTYTGFALYYVGGNM